MPKTTTKTRSVNERLLDLFNARAIDLVRVEAGTRRKIVALLNDLESDISEAIVKIDPTGPARERYQRERLGKLLKQVRATIKAAYRKSNTLMAREIRELIDIEATWTAKSVNDSIGVQFMDAGLSRQQLQTVVSDVLIQGAPSKDWWGRQAAGLADRFADEMRRGIAIGEPNSKLVARIRGTGETRGLMDVSRTSAERLVRASVQTAANAARQAMYEEHTDLIKVLKWSATLDTRTSDWCIVRDGKSYTPKDHKPVGHDVPWLDGPGAIHWGCRSTSVPVLKSWRELGIDADELPTSTRASMDGQVPADTTYEDWLREQSKERQDDVLGEGKADLWRRGKIKFRDLLDQNGRPLSTEELRAKSGG